MADILNEFIEEAKSVYGGNLKSIILYGSKASGEDTKKHSDYNVLIVLDNIKHEDLKALNKVMSKWIKQGNPPPLLFSIPRFIKSADVFPIEFLDMKDTHKVLYGEDPFKNLEIKDVHLRHECEFELKGKLLKLRQGYMLAEGKASKLKDLLIDSISTILILFKHTIRLLGAVPPQKKMEALEVISEKTGINQDVFINVMKMKQGDKEALKLETDGVMQEYLHEIEKIVDIVDNLG
ncbi:MAG: nucleotidyltransferase domain-containing protein [Endomicrobiales bacterium]|nr:nucleotidyltransferase domain-containing protein [Endomicrobiales bacterium]